MQKTNIQKLVRLIFRKVTLILVSACASLSSHALLFEKSSKASVSNLVVILAAFSVQLVKKSSYWKPTTNS